MAPKTEVGSGFLPSREDLASKFLIFSITRLEDGRTHRFKVNKKIRRGVEYHLVDYYLPWCDQWIYLGKLNVAASSRSQADTLELTSGSALDDSDIPVRLFRWVAFRSLWVDGHYDLPPSHRCVIEELA